MLSTHRSVRSLTLEVVVGGEADRSAHWVGGVEGAAGRFVHLGAEGAVEAVALSSLTTMKMKVMRSMEVMKKRQAIV